VQHLYFRPTGETGPLLFPSPPLGPAAQQPTGRPPKRPALLALLGQLWPVWRLSPRAVRVCRSASDGCPAVSQEQNWRPAPHVTLAPVLSAPPRHTHAQAAAATTGSCVPRPAMAGDVEGRRRPARGLGQLLPSSLPLISLPSIL
jgi:hypothetical protein